MGGITVADIPQSHHTRPADSISRNVRLRLLHTEKASRQGREAFWCTFCRKSSLQLRLRGKRLCIEHMLSLLFVWSLMLVVRESGC